MSVFQTYFLYYFIIVSTTLIMTFSKKLEVLRLKRISRVLFIIAVLLPALIAGFRYGIGVDYLNYEKIYYLLTSDNNIISDFINTRYEPGWIMLNYLVKFLFNDVKYVFIISALLICAISFKSINEHKTKINVGVAVLIWLCTMYNPSFNIIRLSLAASILMLSVKPILERKFIKFLFILLLAGSFHYTSLIFLPTYWVINNRIKNIGLIKKTVAVISAILVIILAQPIISFLTSFDVFAGYSHYQVDFTDFGFGFILLKVPVIMIIIFNYRKLKSNNNFIYKLTILYFIGLILHFLSYLEEYVGRVAIYFDMMQIFILAAIVQVQNNKYKKALYIFIVTLYFIGLYTFEIIIKNGHKTIPFMWN